MSSHQKINVIADLQAMVDDALHQTSEAVLLAQKFLHDERVQKYAMGRNEDVLAIHKICPLDGIVDDYLWS